MLYDWDWVGAEEAFRRALELNPGSADIYNNLGNAYADLEEYEQAHSCYATALEIEPGLTTAAINLISVLKICAPCI